jgi:hypothetical protein
VKTEEENPLDESRSEQLCLCPKSTEENGDLERVRRELTLELEQTKYKV